MKWIEMVDIREIKKVHVGNVLPICVSHAKWLLIQKAIKSLRLSHSSHGL